MQNDHHPDDRKNFWIAVAFVITSISIGGLTWFLKYMGGQFLAGFICGFFLMAGLAGILIKDFRNLS